MELLIPFANTGEKEDFSTTTDPTGKVSLEKGFTELYQLKPEEGGEFIPRKVFNQMMYLVTTDTVNWKTQTFPNWIDDKGDGLPFAYPKNALVKYTDGNTYVSKIDNNTSIPTSANWSRFNPLESLENNLTVNVGTGGDFATINEALKYLTKNYYPLYKKSGITATINLKAGFVMAEQVLVSGLDLGWITIVGEDAETIITHTALTTDFTTADYGFNSYPAFGVSKGGVSPRIRQLFRFNVEKVGGNKHGIIAVGAGSSAEVLGGKGFIGAGTYGIAAASGSTITAQSANASGAGTYGIYATQSSTIDASNSNASGAGTYGIAAASGSTITAQSANASGAGTYGIYATQSSTINAQSANASGAGINGIAASLGSTINAQSAIIQNQTTGTSRVSVVDGSHIEASGINTTGGTVPALSQTANTLTGNGIIYQ